MKRIKGIVLLAFLCLLMPLQVQAEEIDQETIKQEISRLAGYDEEEQERTFWFVTAEYEPGKGKACFVAAYYAVRDERVYGVSTYVYGDIWAVKDGIYTKVLTDVRLDGFVKSLELVEMEGRSFILIRTVRNEGYAYLYTFEGTEPVCCLEAMVSAAYNSDRKILTAILRPALGDYENGYLLSEGTFNLSTYFFTCKDGEFTEIVGEPCSREEYYQNTKALEIPEDENMEVSYFCLPDIGYYCNCIYYKENSRLKGEWEFSLDHFLYVDKELEIKRMNHLTGDGYRYASWLERAEEEKQLCEKWVQRIGYNLLGLVNAEYTNPRVRIVRRGESLWSLAEFFCSRGERWVDIYELNKDVIGDNPSQIYPEMVLTMPLL